jgi:hypothetical protein
MLQKLHLSHLCHVSLYTYKRNIYNNIEYVYTYTVCTCILDKYSNVRMHIHPRRRYEIDKHVVTLTYRDKQTKNMANHECCVIRRHHFNAKEA